MSYLPHRYPFILIDRIEEIETGEKIKAIKNVTINEPFFQGHFPNLPVMPGVLIVEALGQAGAVLAFESAGHEIRDRFIYFMGIDKAKFRKPVVPGDQLVLEVKFLRKKSKIIKMYGVAKVDGKIVSEAEMTASIGGKS